MHLGICLLRFGDDVDVCSLVVLWLRGESFFSFLIIILFLVFRSTGFSVELGKI